MTLLYFHCTDGEDVVFDARGRSIAAMRDLPAAAGEVARRLMRRLPRYPDWSSWRVCVYDREGRWVEEIAFPARRPGRAAGASRAAA